jgi:hypothetical protein
VLLLELEPDDDSELLLDELDDDEEDDSELLLELELEDTELLLEVPEDEESAPVGLSALQPVRTPTPARAAPPDSRIRNSRRSERRSSVVSARTKPSFFLSIDISSPGSWAPPKVDLRTDTIGGPQSSLRPWSMQDHCHFATGGCVTPWRQSRSRQLGVGRTRQLGRKPLTVHVAVPGRRS